MDIKELQDYRLSDAIKFHPHLNPKIWGPDEHLLPEVREKLLAIADDFKEFLGLDLEVKDITISGSNAAYTYTDHSDIDLHLVADLPKADASEIYRELFDAKKYQYNDQHNFKIGGYDVELYVQNANEDPKSQGIYSVLNNEWISVPRRRKPDIDDISVKSKYEDLGQRIEAAVKSGDAEQLETLGKKVREFRQAGLDQTGEFGPENLAFKILRSNGTLDQLRAARLAAKDRDLSVDETEEKKPFKYGFGQQKPMEDWHPNEEPPGPESKPEMPAGTVMVDVSDVYDWYKLGQDISDLDHADPKMYGQGAPQTIISFGSEPIEHKYIKKLEKLGLKTHDIDPGGKKHGRETEFKVKESVDDIEAQIQKFAAFCNKKLGIENPPRIQLKRDPEWSKRNATFGRYMPEVNTLTLSVANRHPMDIMRTLAHELVHRRQDEHEPMPGHAGDTGSEWENEANAQAGVLMRDWGAENPGMFDKKALGEGSEQSLSSMVAQDQTERNEYSQFVKSQAGGDWTKGAKMYAQLKKRPSNDIFNDAARLNQFMKMTFDFDKFTDQDWDNYWLLAQHSDDHRDFQKNALLIIKKYQGTDHSHYKYLCDRISCGLTGKQKYGTQDICGTDNQVVAESAVFLNPNAVIVGQDHNKPLNLSPDTLKRVQAIAAKHGARYEGNGKDRTYTKGQIDKYVGSWDDEVAKTAGPNDPKWLYVLFANVDENNRVQRVGVDAQDTIFNRLLATARDNSFQNIGFTSQALQQFLSMASEGKYDFVKMSQQPATQENLSRFLKAGESLMWPSNWEQYPNKAGKIAKSATVDVRDQYLTSRKAGVYVTGSGHLKAVQAISGQRVVAEEQLDEWSHTDSDIRDALEEKGYKFLDSGVDQSAYIEPGTGWILKIFGTQNDAKFKGSPRFSQDHQMFFKWVKFCMKNSGNPFLPRFGGYESFEWKGQTYLQVRQESLASAGQMGSILAEIAESIGSETLSWKEFSQGKVNYSKKTLADKLIKLSGSESTAMLFYNTVKSLFLTGNKHGWTWDLHAGNFMMRGKTPVIADPWVINQQMVAEASGYIPVTDAEAKDPRYSMAITQDIKPGEVKRQAAKMGWKTNTAGTPPTAKTNGLVEELTRKLQLVKEGLTETRNSLFNFVKQQFPTWPDYVLKDFLYQQAKGIRDQAELDDFLKRNKQDFGNCKWTLTKLPITFDIFTPKTQRMLASREGGSSNPFQVPRDAERHAQQSQMIQQKGVSAEPIIVAKLSNGYDLIEGWHRTIQHLKAFPQGYTGPAWVCTGATYKSESVAQGVAEGLGFPLVSEQEQELDEVAMSPSALQAFAASPAAQGMQAGFEAELVFTGVNGGSNDDESDEMEPDYDTDTLTRDIEGIMDFFVSGDMSEISSNSSSPSHRRARSSLEEDYFEWYSEHVAEEFSNDEEDLIKEWILENDWDQDRQIEEFLREELGLSADEVAEVTAAMKRRVDGKGTAADAELIEKYIEAEAGVKEQLELRVSDAMASQDSDYESALDEFRENYDGADESDWLRDRGWRYMSDIENNFDFGWPYWTRSGNDNDEEGGYNPDVARRLASSLSDALGVKTTVSSGYHSAKRDATTWIFEPDGSLDSDDADNMPVEIVSPPMPLSKTLEILPKFFEWAEENGAYANDSTGFHMSVSMPDHAGDLLDYTKLALFLGDEYVLQQFGREANTYAKSALQKIREKKGNANPEEILSTMRKHLSQFASRALASPSGFGKYTSINPKNNYIEFRSAGGSNYFEDMDRIQNTLMRYARAMDIAFDPAADKPEYAKKLYKMLTDVKTQQTVDPKTGTRRTEVKPGGLYSDAISIFSRYVAGEMPKSALKGFIKQIQHKREVDRQVASGALSKDYDPNGQYVIRKKEGGEAVGPILHRFSATGTSAAIAKGEEIAAQLGLPKADFGLYHIENVPPEILNAPIGRTVPATQTPATDQMTAPAADDPAGNYVLRQREGNQGTGPVVHRFSAPNNMAAVEASRQWTTARGIERRSVWLDHVSGVPPEILNARPVGATLGEPRPAFTEPRSSSIPEVPLDIAQNFQEPPASWDSGSPIVSEPQNFPAARAPATGGEFTGRWKIVSGVTGEVLHTFVFRSNDQAAANGVARDWAQRTGFDDTVEVYPEMG